MARASIVNPIPGYVYFIRAPALGLIKIGMAINVSRRIRGLRSQVPVDLELIGAVHCGNPRLYENLLHKYFKASRVRGEWFRETLELVAVADEMIRAESVRPFCARTYPSLPVEERADRASPPRATFVLDHDRAPTPPPIRPATRRPQHSARATLARYKAARGLS